MIARIFRLAQAPRRSWNPEVAESLPAHRIGFPASLFRNVPVRQGIKMGIAGILGFWVALYLRLPNPTWCIFTVVVLMMAQYVGAIAEKSALRAIGTVAGALLGILLVGNHATEPVIMISAAFLSAGFAAMMFGGNLYPYAFFLAGLTTLVVIGQTMESPAKAWPLASVRIVEICLGILVSTIVTSVVWPRYAREEFRACFRSALREAGCMAIERSRLLLTCDCSGSTQSVIRASEIRFASRMNQLRLLLRFGQRESEHFRAKFPIRLHALSELGALFEAAVSLGQRLPKQSRYRDLISSELHTIHELLDKEFIDLSTDTPGRTLRENVALREIFERTDNRLRELRDAGATREIPTQEAMDFSAHYTALKDIAARLRVLRECLYEIRETPDTAFTRPRKADGAEPFRLASFWVRNGIKGGLTAALALLYVNWAHPPGGSILPFAAWLLTSTSKIAPGGQGDRRAFSYVIVIALVGIPYVLLLLLIAPYLADYAWMNLFLFAGLFALGFTIAKQGGISVYAQCGMLFFVGAVGLNPQQPVGFQAIFSAYFGVVLALLFSAVIQRLFWPLLPQREICSLFEEFFACCRKLLEPQEAGDLTRLQNRMALIPSELASWIRVTTTPEYPKGETQRLNDLLRSAERLGYCVLSVRKLDHIEVPEEVREQVRTDLASVEKSACEALQLFEEAFARGRRQPKPPSQMEVFQNVEARLGEVRQRYLSGAMHFPHAVAYLGAMNFLEDAVRTIDCCASELDELSLDRYAGDYAL